MGQLEQVGALNRTVRVNPIEKVRSEQTCEGGEGVGQTACLRKNHSRAERRSAVKPSHM